MGFTRAIRHLHLPPDLKEILIPEWQTALKQYEPPPPPKAPEPNSPRKKRFQIGDSVTISHGTGTIVSIDGAKYLVDLDGQGARLWTREWVLRKA